MRYVGLKAGFAGVALLLASAAVSARAPENTDLPAYTPHPWDQFIADDDESVAQQTPDPAAPPASPPVQPASPPPASPPVQPATPPHSPPAAAPPAAEPPPPAAGTEQSPPTEDVLPDLSGEQPSDDFSVGEIPAVETVELTADTARKAIDAYVMVREKYQDAALENYENLQDFVDQDAKGKEFETDIKSFGFPTVNDWNVAITTVGFAYSNHVEDQTADIKQQIEEVKADTEMAQDMRDRMVQALTAMIPSDNNRTIIADMMKDTAYAEKLKQLETEEE